MDFFVSLFVSLLARLRENGWTDLHEIFREGAEWLWGNLIQFWVKSEKPRDAAMLISLSWTLRANRQTDLHEIFREGVEWPRDDLITFLVNSKKPRGAAMRNTGTGFVVLSHHSLFKTCRESAREVCTIKFTTVLRRGICLNCISARAPIVATWAGRFSRRCWQRFSQFLTCPLTLPPVPASHALFIIFAPRRHCCLATAARGRGRTDTESTRAVLSCSDYCNLTVTEVSC